MKLEIDIDEDYYKIICKRVEENKPYHSPYEQEVIADGKPLEQEPKKGFWMTQWNVAHQKEYYYCSECREEYSYDGETGIKMNDYNFCPNCGCRMVEPQESEVEE